MPKDVDILPFYILALVIGAVIGLSELVSRYKDAPLRALLNFPAALYVGINGVASLAALAVVRQMGWLNDVAPDNPINTLVIQSLAAGLSAMALFRTALFNIRVANADVGIGPAAFLQILLAAADRACDRKRAGPRAAAIQEIMQDVSFALAKQALPTFCFGLMQNVSGDEQRAVGIIVKDLEGSNMPEAFKANNLGLSLMNVVGESVLRQAVNMVRGNITALPQPIVQSIETLSLLGQIEFVKSSQTLVDACLFLANKGEDTAFSKGPIDALRRISAMDLPDPNKVLFLGAALVGKFGEEIVKISLRTLVPAAARDCAAQAPPADSTLPE